METKFNFNSQACTDINQSRRILELGLKKETADCYWVKPFNEWFPIVDRGEQGIDEEDIPAWSLHRLLSLLPRNVRIGKNYYDLVIVQNEFIRLADDLGDTYKYFDKEELYEGLLDCIEWLIKEGYFNKEYLV